MTIAPLNGTKTHPLTEFARDELAKLNRDGPRPCQEFNPGVRNRLLRGGLVTQVMRPSPYKTHKGKPIAHLEITDAGRAELPAERRLPAALRQAVTHANTIARTRAHKFPTSFKGSVNAGQVTTRRKPYDPAAAARARAQQEDLES